MRLVPVLALGVLFGLVSSAAGQCPFLAMMHHHQAQQHMVWHHHVTQMHMHATMQMHQHMQYQHLQRLMYSPPVHHPLMNRPIPVARAGPPHTLHVPMPRLHRSELRIPFTTTSRTFHISTRVVRPRYSGPGELLHLWHIQARTTVHRHELRVPLVHPGLTHARITMPGLVRESRTQHGLHHPPAVSRPGGGEHVRARLEQHARQQIHVQRRQVEKTGCVVVTRQKTTLDISCGRCHQKANNPQPLAKLPPALPQPLKRPVPFPNPLPQRPGLPVPLPGPRVADNPLGPRQALPNGLPAWPPLANLLGPRRALPAPVPRPAALPNPLPGAVAWPNGLAKKPMPGLQQGIPNPSARPLMLARPGLEQRLRMPDERERSAFGPLRPGANKRDAKTPLILPAMLAGGEPSRSSGAPGRDGALLDLPTGLSAEQPTESVARERPAPPPTRQTGIRPALPSVPLSVLLLPDATPSTQHLENLLTAWNAD